MPEEIRYDAALAGGLLVQELFGNDDPRYLSQVTFIILQAIHEAEERLGGFHAKPSAN